MTYPITKNILIPKNYSKTTLVPQGMVVHSTASPGANGEAEINYFNTHPEREASVHGFIDWEKITQTLEFNIRAWHAGGTANSKFIGIELCEPKGHNDTKFNEVWKRATWFYAYIFVNIIKINTITKDNLMSHYEVSNKWHETTHTDPVAFFKSYGKTVDDFRKEVQNQIDLMIQPVVKPPITPNPVKPIPTPTKPSKQRIQVTADNVNIRKFSSITSAVLGQAHNGDNYTSNKVIKEFYEIIYGNNVAYISTKFAKVV